MKKAALLALLFCLLLLATSVWAVPGTINYQGVLTDSVGVPLNQDVSITFRLYDAATAGTEAWSETQTVSVSNGVYSAQLGQSTSLDGVDFSVDYWLEVEAGGEILTPRQALTSVPYAMHAQYADGVAANTTIDLSVATESASEATLKGTNTGNGYGVYGWSGSNIGVYGYSVPGPGVFGTSNDGISVQGLNGATGNEGQLGTATVGVYGKGVSANSYGVKGEYATTGNLGALGTSFSGVYGVGKGTANGIYGTNENGNYGYLGGALYGLYSSAHDSNSYAGYFLGKTTISGGQFELRNSTGENWLSFLRGSGQNAGFAFKEEGATDTQWIFPYFRGWQSDNLIVRDEMANIDVMTFETDSGNVGIGTNAPEGLLHISAGTAGDAQVVIEADTDNNNENDQPSILFKQDGGLVTGRIGFEEGSNNLRVRASESIQFIVKDSDDKDVLVATFDENGMTHPDKTSFLSLPPHAFAPRYSGVEYGGSAGAIWSTSDTIAADFVAPVLLPHGARIARITCWWSDYSDKDMSLYFNKISFTDGTQMSLAQLSSSGGAGTRVLAYSADIPERDVDNSSSSYTISIHMPEDDQSFFFYGARIEYVVTEIK